MLKKLLVIPPVVVGILVFAVLLRSRQDPQRVERQEEAQTVRVIEVSQAAVTPRVVGYGTAQPGKVWQAVAEVKGRIVELHPQLKRGAMIPAGAVLIRIDPTAYTLMIDQTKSNIRSVRAQLAELDVRAANTQASLDIEIESLSLAQQELQRIQGLLTKYVAGRSQVDQEKRTVLTQQNVVQGLRNTLNLIPVERERLQAQLALYQAQLKTAEFDLEHTTIIAPFASRIAQVNVETTQFVSVGQVLVIADGIEVAEITAQFPLDKIRKLLTRGADAAGSNEGVMDTALVWRDLSARVRLRSGDISVVWEARVARISETIDPKTRTVGVVVVVDEPYAMARPGIRPPIVKEMFLEVELRGKPRPACLVVPRSALRGGHVHVLTSSERLETRAVQLDFAQRDIACLKGGLQAGETIIISDLLPVIEGIRLKPVWDEALQRTLSAQAIEEATVR